MMGIIDEAHFWSGRMSRPNILLLISDEHPPQLTGCYGHRRVRTPTIDGLGARGAIFDAAYCPSPICAPSRAAMMTSRHVHEIGVWDNASPLGCDQPTFAHAFRRAGYLTALCGKMHFVGPDQLHGFEQRWTQDIYPADFRWTRPHRKGPPVNPGQNIDRVYEAGPGWSVDMDYDEEVMFRAWNGLREMAKHPPGRPWLLAVSFTAPHFPFRAPPRYWELYDESAIDLPTIPDDYREREHAYVGWLRRHGRFDHLVPDDVCRRARRAILARTTMLDDYLARVLETLRSEGLDENTIVIYLSDHGEMLGEHGLWYKNAAYEWSARVPLIVSGPGIEPRRIGEVVSLLDLGPTLCGLAGIEPIAPRSDGRDLSDLIRGRRGEEAGLAIMENYGEGVWRGVRTIRCGSMKLTWAAGTEPELFDLDADPDEWRNVAGDPAYATARERLMRRLMEDWDPDACDEARWRSEERRAAIQPVMAGRFGWQYPSPPPVQPLGYE
jgi:choline-sulfatase